MKQCPTCGVRFYEERSKLCPIDGASLVDLPDPLIGRVIQERYVVEALLGTGGMGSVYRGRHQLINRHVALKFLANKHVRDDNSRQRFLREARAVNRVQHDHIIDVSDFGETDDGLVYIVMEYLSGRTLGDDIAEGRLSVERTCRIALQLALALGRAHELGVVHRDIKPNNIFLIRKGDDPDFVKLLDFGLARAADDITLTRSNLLFGTPEYMAPETATQSPVDMKADLYAFGCVLFEMLTGRLPFEGAPTGLIFKHVYEAPPRPTQFFPDLPKVFDVLVLRLLEKNPARRPANAYEVADELTRIAASLPLRAAPSQGGGGSQRMGQVNENEARALVTPRTARTARTARAVIDQTEEERWQNNLVALQARIAERYHRAPAPDAVQTAMRRVEELVQQAHDLRKNLVALDASTVEHHDSTRAAQSRVGAAIDALALDEARTAQELETLNRAHAQAAAALHTQASALLNVLADIDEGRTVEAPLLQTTRAWAVEQRTLRTLADRLTQVEVARVDLRFQIAHLKGRLASLDAESSIALEPTLARAGDVQQRLSEKLVAIRSEAERITEQLARTPQAS